MGGRGCPNVTGFQLGGLVRCGRTAKGRVIGKCEAFEQGPLLRRSITGVIAFWRSAASHSLNRCAIADWESPGDAGVPGEPKRFARGSFAPLRMTVWCQQARDEAFKMTVWYQQASDEAFRMSVWCQQASDEAFRMTDAWSCESCEASWVNRPIPG